MSSHSSSPSPSSSSSPSSTLPSSSSAHQDFQIIRHLFLNGGYLDLYHQSKKEWVSHFVRINVEKGVLQFSLRRQSPDILKTVTLRVFTIDKDVNPSIYADGEDAKAKQLQHPLDRACLFGVTTYNKQYALKSRSSSDRSAWLKALDVIYIWQQHINQAIIRGVSEGVLGKKDHWIEDKEGSFCGMCKRSFSFLTRRKHHCRECGFLFCSSTGCFVEAEKCCTKCGNEPMRFMQLNTAVTTDGILAHLQTGMGGMIKNGNGHTESTKIALQSLMHSPNSSAIDGGDDDADVTTTDEARTSPLSVNSMRSRIFNAQTIAASPSSALSSSDAIGDAGRRKEREETVIGTESNQLFLYVLVAVFVFIFFIYPRLR